MPTIEDRAREKLNAVKKERGCNPLWEREDDRKHFSAVEAMCREIEAHDATLAEFEAFKREVSDAVKAGGDLSRFIIPEPVDPMFVAMVEAVKDCGYATLDAIEPEFAADLRAALAKRGLKLVEVGDDD